MMWAADETISASELREVADETGLGVGNNFMAFAAFVAEKCAVIADRQEARGQPAGEEIRRQFARCWLPDESTPIPPTASTA